MNNLLPEGRLMISGIINKQEIEINYETETNFNDDDNFFVIVIQL